MDVTWDQYPFDHMPGPFASPEDSVLFDLIHQSDRNWYAGQHLPTYRQLTDAFNARCGQNLTPNQVIEKIDSQYIAFKRCFPPIPMADEHCLVDAPNYACWQVSNYNKTEPRRKQWEEFETRALIEVYKVLGARHKTVARAMNQIASSRNWPAHITGRKVYTAGMCSGRRTYSDPSYWNFPEPDNPDLEHIF